ncbi:MAG TPA: NAD-dependent epimerase/dehydratase family protein [Gaiellaceae bacterium]|nr:NAD-dependent epimerase/dehydratase family protein [Gaiellaceae bacterium]
MRVLILGGTKFLGRAIAEAALARGHELTLFNRGETNPELFPEAERLRGDRTGDLSVLAGRAWDAVIDPSGYVPSVVRASAELLRTSGRYVFVSSISAYADFSTGPDEGSAVAELGDAPIEELASDYSNYGPLKALCEAEVVRVFGDRGLVVRPGLIVGPHDPTGRFTYWAQRLARGGETLAPGPAERRVQFVDVRDLAEWIVAAAEQGLAGTYNATNEGVSWAELLAGADVTWVPDGFLQEHEVGEWMELPLWIADPALAGLHGTDVSRAVAAGLRFRPLPETIAGAATAPAVEGVGLTPEREAALLSSWHGRAA